MHNSSAGFQPEGPTISRRSVYAMFWPPSQIKTGFAAFRVHPGIVGRKVQRLHRLQHHAKPNALCARTPDIVIGAKRAVLANAGQCGTENEIEQILRIAVEPCRAQFCCTVLKRTEEHPY